MMTRAFYSIQDSKTPVRSAVIAVCVNVVLNLTLIWFMGTAGLALSTAICSYLQVIILLSVLRKRMDHPILTGFSLSLIKVIVATILMSLVGITINYLMRNLPANTHFNVLRLAVVVPSAIIVYAVSAKMLRIESLSLITQSKFADN
jgi:putative peptidoglycan lipid II flippase